MSIFEIKVCAAVVIAIGVAWLNIDHYSRRKKMTRAERKRESREVEDELNRW
jgi:hypothetical protein